MRAPMQFFIVVVACCAAAPAAAQVTEAETQAALAAFEHLRSQFPFSEVVLAATRDAEGRQNTAFTDVLARAGRVRVETADMPLVVCEDRCRQTRKESRVSVVPVRASGDSATVYVSWLVPIERDGVLHVRSGRGHDVELIRRNARWEVVAVGEVHYFVIGHGPGR